MFLPQSSESWRPVPRRFRSSICSDPVFVPPLRLKLTPGLSVQLSRVWTIKSTVLPSQATGTITASYR